MGYKNIRLIMVVIVAFTILSPSCSIQVIRNYYTDKPTTQMKTNSTTFVLQFGFQTN